MSNFWDELMETFGRGPIRRPPPRHGHHRPKAPPKAAFIRKLTLEIRYSQHHSLGIFQMSRVNLSWSNPTTRTDGTALSPDEIASVDVFDDVSDGNGPQKIGTVTGAGTSFATGTVAVGNHAFTVVVNDTAGHKSAPSNVASVSIAPTLAAPSAVQDLTATVVEE